MAGKPKPKTHCNYGHAMTPENMTVIQMRGNQYPHRQCRTCMELTRADVEAIEVQMREGGTFRDLSPPFTKKLGLETYRALNPEWSAQMFTIAGANARGKKKVAFAALAQRLTHCKNGHELTPDNVKLVIVKRNGWHHRECKTCRAGWDTRRVCERMRRNGDRSSRRVRTLVTQLARSRLIRESGRMRADIHDGPEHTLQSEAGYSNARPHNQVDETSCTARPDHTVGSIASFEQCPWHVGSNPDPGRIAATQRADASGPGCVKRADECMEQGGDLFDHFIGRGEQRWRNG